MRVVGMTKRYAQLSALEGVTFSIQPGEVLGVIGPNGAGKTTLFECVAGVMPATAGVLLCDGQVVDARMRSSALFYVPDAIAPWPAQPVSWVLDFAVGFFGGLAALRDEVVRSLSLDPLLGAPIGSLSKGERKRALLALGLLTPQPLLLVDEPFDGLDLKQSREAAAALRAGAARGRTLVLSIHQIADAQRLCDRFVLLSGGRVRGEGTFEELQALATTVQDRAFTGGLEEIFLALT